MGTDTPTEKYAGHTPGPWEYTRNIITKRPVGIYGFEDGDPDIELCPHAVIVPEWPREEQEANARLIADAPKLLAERDELQARVKELEGLILSISGDGCPPIKKHEKACHLAGSCDVCRMDYLRKAIAALAKPDTGGQGNG